MSKRTRLLLVSDYFFPHWTGIVKGILNMTKGLAEEMDITVLTVRYNDQLAPEETLHGVRIVRSPYLMQLSRACYSPQLVFDFLREVRKCDTVLINSPCSNVLPVSLLAALFGKRIVIFHQGDLTLTGGLMNRVIEGIFSICTWVGMSLAKVVSTYTRDYGEQSRVLKPFIHKFSPLLMPIVLPEGSSEVPERLRHLAELKAQGKVIFGFGGRFVDEKGFDVLFRAIPPTVAKLPNAHFAFAGETKIFYEDTFERQQNALREVESSVSMLGLLNDHELVHYFQLIDFIVIPSRSDCFPIFQAEATVSGNPSICADIPGARHLVKATGFGLIFKKEDHAALADAMAEAVARREELLARHGEVLKLFDPATVLGNIRTAITGVR